MLVSAAVRENDIIDLINACVHAVLVAHDCSREACFLLASKSAAVMPTVATLVAGVALFAHNAYKDVVAIGQTIRAQPDTLQWTIARVPILTSHATKEVVAGYIGDGKVNTTLSRAGFAAFCVQQLSSNEWVNKAPLVSTP